MIYPRTFYIETYGCTFNQSDSEKISRTLLDAGFLPSSQYHAEFIIINTCAVKSQTEAKIFHKIKSLSLLDNQKLLITGCLPWIAQETLDHLQQLNPKIKGIFDSHSYFYLPQLLDSLEGSMETEILRNLKNTGKSKILPGLLYNGKPGIIQLAEGCNFSCSYCCTRISRGRTISFPIEDIIHQIQYYIKNGVKEIYLTAQDCGSYNSDSKSLVDLIREIHRQYGNEEILVRLGMIHPNQSSEIGELGQILQSSKIFYKFLHVPIQSGSNRVLNLMNRGYSNDSLDTIFKKLHELNITISTDIICGFPNESTDDFLQTYNFVNKHQPDVVNISKFIPRPGTVAKKMKQLNSEVIKRRTHALTKLYLTYSAEKNKRWIGWKGRVLIHGFRPDEVYKYSGRNSYYKSIALKEGRLGSYVTAEIVGLLGQFLIGKVV